MANSPQLDSQQGASAMQNGAAWHSGNSDMAAGNFVTATSSSGSLASALNKRNALPTKAVSGLSLIEESSRRVKKNEVLQCPEQPMDKLFTVVEGWACGYRQLLDGQCQILDIYLPGDVIGLSKLQSLIQADGVSMISPGIVRACSRENFVNLTEKMPSIYTSVMQLIDEEQARRNERIVNLGAKTRSPAWPTFLLSFRCAAVFLSAIQ